MHQKEEVLRYIFYIAEVHEDISVLLVLLHKVKSVRNSSRPGSMTLCLSKERGLVFWCRVIFLFVKEMSSFDRVGTAAEKEVKGCERS